MKGADWGGLTAGDLADALESATEGTMPRLTGLLSMLDESAARFRHRDGIAPLVYEFTLARGEFGRRRDAGSWEQVVQAGRSLAAALRDLP